MATEAKAKVIAAKKISESIDSISEYVDKTVEKFIAENKKELKKAINESKKLEVYNKMKSLVESTFGIDNVEKYNALVEKYNVLKKASFETADKADKKVKELEEAIENLKSNLIFEKKVSKLDSTKVPVVTKIVESMEFKNHDDFEKKLDVVINMVTEKTATKIQVNKTVEKKPVVEAKVEKKEVSPVEKIRKAITETKVEKKEVVKEAKEGVIDPNEVGFGIFSK